MNLPIYVLGDLSAFISVLNSVAMVFNDTPFIGGAALLGAFVTLLAFLVSMINKEAGSSIIPGGSPLVGLFAFIIFFSSLGIKTTVVVQDKFTGNSSVVANIPALISLPASAFTSAVNAIFGKTNTAFQGTDGSFIALGEQGFVQPLKVLSTLRNSVSSVDPFLAATTHQFVMNCTLSSGVNMNSLQNSPDVIGYLTSNARDNGLTTVYSVANPDGVSTSCAQAKSIVANASAALLTTADPALGGKTKIATLVTRNLDQKTSQGTPPTAADVEDAVQRVVLNRMAGTTQSAGQFMLNSVMYNTLTNSFNCRDKSGDQAAYTACDTMATQAYEQWKTEAAGAGTMFTKTMLPAMVFMQIMFFSFAPIVLIFALIKGAGGIPTYVKFLGFGMWTASWLPVAGVIQMYIQNNVAGKLSQLNDKALTMGNFKVIYHDVISTNLALASDMLAATPIVTATILGISVAGMGALASRYGGANKVDPTIATPNLVGSSPLVQSTGMRDVNANTGVSTQTGAVLPTVSFSSGGSAQVQSANSVREGAQRQVGQELSTNLQNSEQRMLARIQSASATKTTSNSTGGSTTNTDTLSFGNRALTSQQQQASATAVTNATASMSAASQISASLAPALFKALSAKKKPDGTAGANPTEADVNKFIQDSAQANIAKDSGFLAKVASGDKDAIASLVDGAINAASVAGFVIGSIGTPAAGAGVGLGVKAAGVAGRGAMIAGVQKAVESMGGAAERMRGASAAVFDNTSAGLKAEISAQLQNSQAFANTNVASNDKFAQALADMATQTYTKNDTTNARQTGNQTTDTTQQSAVESIGKAFKVAETKTQAADSAYTKSVAQSRDSGVQFSGTADKFVAELRGNSDFAQRLRQSYAAEDKNTLLAEGIKGHQATFEKKMSGLKGDESEMLGYAMVLASRGDGAKLLPGNDPAAGMRADSNAGLKAPNVSAAADEAERRVPAASDVRDPNTSEVTPLTGKSLTRDVATPEDQRQSTQAEQQRHQRHQPVAQGQKPAAKPAPQGMADLQQRARALQQGNNLAAAVGADTAPAMPTAPNAQNLDTMGVVERTAETTMGKVAAGAVAATAGANVVSGFPDKPASDRKDRKTDSKDEKTGSGHTPGTQQTSTANNGASGAGTKPSTKPRAALLRKPGS